MSLSGICRLDRTLSLMLAWVSVHNPARSQRPQLPVVMYHGISSEISSRHPYFQTTTSPIRFRQQVALLAQLGYESCDLRTATCLLSTGAVVGRRVVITFDDGFADLFDYAWPVLREFGFSATVFVITSMVRKQRSIRDGKEYLGWDELRQLSSMGMRVGSHTVTHRNLASLSSAEIDEELRISKEAIEDHLGISVESFACPHAFPEAMPEKVSLLRDRLQHNGYQNGVSTKIGIAGKQSDVYFLPRLPINTFDDDELLSAKLKGAYNWLHAFQYGKKLACRWREQLAS